MEIETYEDLLVALQSGKYTSIGSYPVFFVMADGQPMSYDAVAAELDRIKLGFADREPEWTVIGMDVNWENPELYCCHTGERIESAYAEEEVADDA